MCGSPLLDDKFKARKGHRLDYDITLHFLTTTCCWDGRLVVEAFSSLAEHNPIRKTTLQMYIGSIYCNQKVTKKHQWGELFTHTGTWLKL
jgi:hypothetical protein